MGAQFLSVQRVPYCSVMSNKAVQIDLLHQQTEIQAQDETCLQQPISMKSESHLSIFSSLMFYVVRLGLGEVGLVAPHDLPGHFIK